tara:strand:+ start:845 stop:1144 length:300 start_codon:yes stop_codon:yes gene_type:complete
MPTYDYTCEKCNYTFESVHTISDRNKPCKKSCPSCGEKSVKKTWAGCTPGLASDSTLTPDKKTNGQWSEMMNRVKKITPNRCHATLDKATNRTGRRWKG